MKKPTYLPSIVLVIVALSLIPTFALFFGVEIFRRVVEHGDDLCAGHWHCRLIHRHGARFRLASRLPFSDTNYFRCLPVNVTKVLWW